MFIYSVQVSVRTVIAEKLVRKLSLTVSGFKLVFIGQSMLCRHTNGFVY